MESCWPRVRFVDIQSQSRQGQTISGKPMPLRVVADLGGLQPEDVRVEAVVGRVSGDGQLLETEVLSMPSTGVVNGHHVFEQRFTPLVSGRLGYTFRVSPNHNDDPLRRPCDVPVKWGQ